MNFEIEDIGTGKGAGIIEVDPETGNLSLLSGEDRLRSVLEHPVLANGVSIPSSVQDTERSWLSVSKRVSLDSPFFEVALSGVLKTWGYRVK